uniref:UDP-glucuronosyltransferase n=1 Tax=Clastoptera arizonana TaxID=38151 RepID=A0A1B6DZV4_9HEMI
MIRTVLSLLLLSVLESQAAQILAILPVPLISHHLYFRPILRGLVDKGHNVTVITMTPEDDANYNQIIIERKGFDELKSHVDFFEMRKYYWFVYANMLSTLGEFSGHVTLQHPEVQRMLHTGDYHFDLVLVETTFVQEAYVVFGHKFGAPVIELQSMCTSFWSNQLMSNSYPFSYFVDYRTRSDNKMDFIERLKNTILGISSIIVFRYILLPKQQALVNQYMRYDGWEGRPSLIDQLTNTSLAIVNTHVALHYPQPNNPNIIYAPGVQIRAPKELPQGFKSFFDNAKEGVVYFSLGTNLNSSMMPEPVQQIFISAFAKLPYNVLWKWETEKLPNQSKNVKLTKWCPQTDVLAHSKLKAFITQGGVHSITEAVSRAVPLVVIPLFLDQFKNSKHVETSGFGIVLNFDNITVDSVLWAMNEIIKPSYKEAAKRQSAILHDNPLPPLDNAIFWIEYVMRHKGAEHLRTGAAELSWYQYFLIDVIVFVTTIILSVLALLLFLFKEILKCLCGRKTRQNIKASKKKK